MNSSNAVAVDPSADKRLLIVFTRYPEPGSAKTRLSPALGPSGAAQLQRLMTERCLARVGATAAWPSWETEIRFDGGSLAQMRSWVGEMLNCLPQSPGDLGERLRRSFGEGFARGASRVVVIGSDCPDLGAADIAAAFDALGSCDVVFGPARDGGYWLIGLRDLAFPAAAGALFSGIAWGSGEVLAASRAAAAGAGLADRCLRMLADVDRPEDLHLWERALRNDQAGLPISVVIPALEEAGRIGPLVADLTSVPGVEVIVADGGSADGTSVAAAACGARLVAGRRGRASQMNAGAAAATGGILLFLHADTRLPVGWAAAVRALLANPAVVGGAFSFSTDSKRPGMRLIEAATNWRGRSFGILFGDQAIFARRAEFAAVGGFPDQPLMEDFELARRLRRRGKVIVLAQRAVTSARRWEARGLLRNSLLNLVITGGYLAGVSVERLCRWYGDSGRNRDLLR